MGLISPSLTREVTKNIIDKIISNSTFFDKNNEEMTDSIVANLDSLLFFPEHNVTK